MEPKRWRIDPELSFLDLLAKIKGMTPSQVAIALFLAIREAENDAATLKEIQDELGFSPRTIDTAMAVLKKKSLLMSGI